MNVSVRRASEGAAERASVPGTSQQSVRPRPRLLVVDDEPAITSTLSPVLERAGFDVRIAGDGVEALAMVEDQAPDLVVSDVLMPRMDGREMVRRLRARGRWVPVILLTQVGETYERVAALDEGADDYLAKPFETAELISRVGALLRRAGQGQPSLVAAPVLRSSDLTVDRLARRTVLGDAEVPLTPKASLLLEHLMAHPGELHTRERLLAAVWGFDGASSTRAVDHRIREIRRALGDDAADPRFIETVQGMGYRFRGQVIPG